MKILWVKSDFLHPTDRGGQIRTLETLKRLHQRHEIHYVALDLVQQPGAVERASEYCTKAYQRFPGVLATARRKPVFTGTARR